MEKHISFTFQATATKPEGVFSAVVCTFETPMKSGPVVKRGAFTQSLRDWRARNKRIPVVWSHENDPLFNVGEIAPTDIEETHHALVVNRGQLYLGEERGRKVFQQLTRHMLEWSFSARIVKARDRDGVAELVTLDLIECGPCYRGDGQTQTLMVASADEPAFVAALRQQIARAQLAPYRQQVEQLRRRAEVARLR